MQSMHGEFLKLFQCMQPLYIVICKCTTCHHNVRRKEGNCIVLMKTHPLSRISSCNCRLLPDLSFQRRHILTYSHIFNVTILLFSSKSHYNCLVVERSSLSKVTLLLRPAAETEMKILGSHSDSAISKDIKGRNYEWMRNSKQSQFVEKEKLQTATT